MDARIIDAHAHCGIRDRFPPQSFEDYRASVRGSEIHGVVMFSPVMEIYDRYDMSFHDTHEWRRARRESNEYLLTLGGEDFWVFPYLFIWNDFAIEDLTPRHKGIKWHRHPDEPPYEYHNPRCRAAIDEIRRRGMPIVLEEEFQNTVRFIEEWAAGTTVIIPHLGALNGGYNRIRAERLWEKPNVYADTSLAGRHEIMDYIDHCGHERLLFGSDFPFGDPLSELRKVMQLPLDEEIKLAIASRNVLRLLAASNVSHIGLQQAPHPHGAEK